MTDERTIELSAEEAGDILARHFCKGLGGWWKTRVEVTTHGGVPTRFLVVMRPATKEEAERAHGK